MGRATTIFTKLLGQIAAMRRKEPMDDELMAYFRDAPRLRYQHIDTVVADIGRWYADDDWDWGRRIYEWRSKGVRIMVCTQSDYIRKVILLDPNDKSRFGTTLEILLDEPFDIER